MPDVPCLHQLGHDPPAFWKPFTYKNLQLLVEQFAQADAERKLAFLTSCVLFDQGRSLSMLYGLYMVCTHCIESALFVSACARVVKVSHAS
jgi:hypothetical protein